MASPSSSSTRTGTYDVFLSFRGPDTRKNIVSHLYKAFRNEGINIFKDDRTIEKGDSIPEKLSKAIQTSQFAIIVISKNYANSTWCLEELRMIMEFQAERVLNVVPIFYEVEPTDVRHQRGSFETAFANMGCSTTAEKISEWKKALAKVADLLGFNTSTWVDEATMVEEVVRDISGRLFPRDNVDDLLGMSRHMESLGSLLETESEEEVRFVGISGMGGVGKTAIARHLYHRFSRQFSAHCFLEDVKKIYKDGGHSYLEREFLSKIFGAGSHGIKERLKNLKVFVVLDNVDKVEQLAALAGDQSWFAPGSRIIITTRDKSLLRTCNVDAVFVYPVKCLNQEDSLHMFKHIAYRERGPPRGFEQLLIRASRLAHGLPLALNAYSLYFRGKTKEEWEREVPIFEKSPQECILNILKRSYEGLDSGDKIAFLHVACLFNGDHFLRASTLLDDGEHRITVLVEKSLVDISAKGSLQMHVLVEKMGRQIVLEESNYSAQSQRILWEPLKVYYVLCNNTGTEKIEGLVLHTCDMPRELCVGVDSFRHMTSVKFLKVYKQLNERGSKLGLHRDIASLPSMLRLLHWDAYPLETLPSNFFPSNLVELTLRYSNLKKIDNTNLDFQKLKRLDVSGSMDLRELSYFPRDMQLEELIVKGCKRLKRVVMLTRRKNTFRILDLSNCDRLQRLPDFIPEWISAAEKPIYFQCQGTRLQFEINTLGTFANLSLEGNIKIRLRGLEGDAEHLSYISEQQTTDELRLRRPSHWPESQTFGNLLEIKRSYYKENDAHFRCLNLSAFSCLAELKLINLNIRRVPEDIYLLHSLEKLDLTGNDFTYLPTTLGNLEKLNHVILCHCRNLEKLPNLTQLQTLKLSGCTNLQSLMVSHGGIYRLLELDLDNCRNVQSLSQQLCHFIELMLLDLSTHEFQTIPESITEFLQLGTLCLNNCKELKSLGELPPSLNYLNAHSCISLETVSLPYKHSIKHLDLSDCSRLNQGEEVINQFLSEGKHEEVSLRFACIPGTEVPSYFDNQPTGKSIRLSSKVLGFAACIMVACERPFHLQFPTSSYSWNWEAGGVFRINLRPNIYSLSGTEKQKAVAKDYLVIIKVLSNKNNYECSNILFKPELQFSQEFPSPPVEIKACGIHMIQKPLKVYIRKKTNANDVAR